MSEIKRLAKETLTKIAEQTAGNNLQHPVHKLLEIIQRTPIDLLQHEYKQAPDGSMKITFDIPSRAEQAKQKAMEEAMQQQQQGGGVQLSPESDVGGAPAGAPNVSKMPARDPGMPAAAAASKVEVKVAMSKEDTSKLKGKFPENFLKNMGLL